MSAEPEPQEPGTDIEPTPELWLDLESAFDQSVQLSDGHLYVAVDALHGFLDALCPQSLHDERIGALAQFMDECDEAGIVPDESGMEKVCDGVRDWIVVTRDAVQGYMAVTGIERSAIWVYHPVPGLFMQWSLTSTGLRSISGGQV